MVLDWYWNVPSVWLIVDTRSPHSLVISQPFNLLKYPKNPMIHSESEYNSSQQDRVLVLNEYHYLGVQDKDYLGLTTSMIGWSLKKAIYYVTKNISFEESARVVNIIGCYLISSMLSTFPLFLLPRFYCHFIFLKLIAPIWVYFLIVCSFIWSTASVGVNSNVVTWDKLTIVDTIVTTGVLLLDGDDDETLLAGDYVLFGAEVNSVPPLGLAIGATQHRCSHLWSSQTDPVNTTSGHFVQSLPSTFSWRVNCHKDLTWSLWDRGAMSSHKLCRGQHLGPIHSLDHENIGDMCHNEHCKVQDQSDGFRYQKLCTVDVCFGRSPSRELVPLRPCLGRSQGALTGGCHHHLSIVRPCTRDQSWCQCRKY